MAARDDLAVIERAAHKAQTILRAAATTIVTVSADEDLDGETNINLTPAQRQQIMDNLAPLVAIIKAKAAGLP